MQNIAISNPRIARINYVNESGPAKFTAWIEQHSESTSKP
jgi:hypothetical protein